MKIMVLYTDAQNESCFKEVSTTVETTELLGNYSKSYPVESIQFSEFQVDSKLGWHNSSKIQYIIYLAGKMEIELSTGEKHLFQAGDILLAADTTGKGHRAQIIAGLKAIIITADQHSISLLSE